MKIFHLVRLTDTGLATFGQLINAENGEIAVTLELPWRNNAHSISCIPAGTYTAKRRFSPKHHGEVFGLLDVPDRSDIEIHAGNFARDSIGCVLLGAEFGVIDEEHCILDSRKAFARFMASMLGVDEFTLTIANPHPR